MNTLREAESADDYEKICNRDGMVFFLDHTLDNIEIYRNSESGSHVAVIGKDNFKEISTQL